MAFARGVRICLCFTQLLERTDYCPDHVIGDLGGGGSFVGLVPLLGLLPKFYCTIRRDSVVTCRR